jgi:hypothetical protein
MNAIKKAESRDDGYIPFAIRFKAWWEGLDPQALVTPKKTAANPLAIEVDDPEPQRSWPESRVAFCRRLWELEETDEVVEPGGAEYTEWLMKPMGLTSEGSSADLSAGLGGGLRKTAAALQVYIDGFEPDAELAALGHALSVKHGMDRRAAIQPYSPEDLTLAARRYTGVLCRERCYRIADKPQFLEMLFESLRPRGHLVITDYVLADGAEADDHAVTGWLSRAPDDIQLWTAEDYRKTLVPFGMDMRIAQDDTDHYRSILLQGWTRFVAGLGKTDLTRDFVNEMMREAEYWLMLIRALESGKLRYYRFHAIRGGESL